MDLSLFKSLISEDRPAFVASGKCVASYTVSVNHIRAASGNLASYLVITVLNPTTCGSDWISFLFISSSSCDRASKILMPDLN
jgi:hypothetical protein